MAAEKVYVPQDVPAELDKPRFNFSDVSYKQGREMNELQVRIQQKNKALVAAQEAEDIEVLAEKLESLLKEQSAYTSKHGQANKILQARIRNLEKKIEEWQEPDVKALVDEINTLLNQQETHILAAVEYVPQAWLINGAPPAESIDWRDHVNLKWLRSDKFQSLAKAKGEAQNTPN